MAAGQFARYRHEPGHDQRKPRDDECFHGELDHDEDTDTEPRIADAITAALQRLGHRAPEVCRLWIRFWSKDGARQPPHSPPTYRAIVLCAPGRRCWSNLQPIASGSPSTRSTAAVT